MTFSCTLKTTCPFTIRLLLQVLRGIKHHWTNSSKIHGLLCWIPVGITLCLLDNNDISLLIWPLNNLCSVLFSSHHFSAFQLNKWQFTSNHHSVGQKYILNRSQGSYDLFHSQQQQPQIWNKEIYRKHATKASSEEMQAVLWLCRRWRTMTNVWKKMKRNKLDIRQTERESQVRRWNA